MSKANLANAILGAPISDTDTTATLATGYGAIMPVPPFKLTFTPYGQLSTFDNSEIVLVTAITDDELTIERGMGGTTAKSFEAGDIVSNGIYIENSVAVGDIFMSLRSSPSVGRLFMDGGTYDKADYPLMYDLVANNAAYGVVGGTLGSETFTLADMRERMPFGKSGSAPFDTLGAKGGEVEHTLLIDEMPSHTHIQNSHLHSVDPPSTTTSSNGDHNHRQHIDTWMNVTPRDGLVPTSGAFNARAGAGTYNTYNAGAHTHTLNIPAFNSASTTATNQNTGGGQPHNNMSPYIVVNYEVVCG